LWLLEGDAAAVLARVEAGVQVARGDGLRKPGDEGMVHLAHELCLGSGKRVERAVAHDHVVAFASWLVSVSPSRLDGGIQRVAACPRALLSGDGLTNELP
jgi:hypothetical protein